MGYPLRQYLPGVTYEITARTLQGRFLMRPSETVRETILGILGRAQALYPGVKLHYFVFLSNHYHKHVTPSHGDEMAKYLQYVNGNIARRIGALNCWEGKFWQGRASVVPILDDKALEERVRYLLLNGVKEGLVRSPREWPGATAVGAFLGDMRIETTWIDFDRRRRARRRRRRAPGTTAPPEDNTLRYVIRLTPYPMWQHLNPEELRARHAAMVAEVELQAKPKTLGVERILRQQPHEHPRRPARRTPPPDCHTSLPAIGTAFRRAYRRFVAAFREVMQTYKDQSRAATRWFPVGSFPRPPWFRRVDHVPDALARPAPRLLPGPA